MTGCPGTACSLRISCEFATSGSTCNSGCTMPKNLAITIPGHLLLGIESNRYAYERVYSFPTALGCYKGRQLVFVIALMRLCVIGKPS